MFQKNHTPLWIAVLIAPCIVCIGLTTFPVIFHNTQLDRFSDNLYAYPLPLETTILSRKQDISLRGNGNHCDFYAEQIMSTKLSRQEIETHYSGLELPGIGIENDKVFVNVSFDELPSNVDDLVFKIDILDFGNPTYLDFRCH